MKESKLSLGILLYALGLCIAIIPPTAAILCYFPVWVERGGEYLLSGIAVLLLLIAFIPLSKLIKRALASASALTVWTALFIIFLAVSKIADEMVVITFVGMLSNAVGGGLMKIGERVKR